MSQHPWTVAQPAKPAPRKFGLSAWAETFLLSGALFLAGIVAYVVFW